MKTDGKKTYERPGDPKEGEVWGNLYRDLDGKVYIGAGLFDSREQAAEGSASNRIGFAHGVLVCEYSEDDDDYN